MTHTNILVEADIAIRHRETGEKEKLTVSNIPCLWIWDDMTRHSAEYWAVSDWIEETFGNNIDWFSIVCIVGSPVKDKELEQ